MSSEFLEQISKLTPKRLALLAAQLNAQVQAQAERARAPIAVVGMGCRLPGGAEDPQAFWELLRDGRNGIREVPAERWDIDALYDPDPDAPGRMCARAGGFLNRISHFDPEFFGITPREAQTLDPQQRLLLEVTWEALEEAGIAPSSLAGSSTGVFVGICASDHFQRALGRGHEAIDMYVASGNAFSVAAGRLSYFLGLHGPSMSIDTSCSSSLVALHLACQSLRRGESQVAIVAGVNLMCSPETSISLSKAHALAPDARCKTFDAAANGIARGEGCGVLVLKRLADATNDGDRILAVVRGSAVDQDGKSGGLTVPSGPAQEAVIRAALADASVQPAEVDYLEAHGTGTSLGDPIEVRAVANALGAGRPADAPLVLGSVKTNLGHLESAAGIVGVMKVILALQNEHIPKHLNFKDPSPHIPWSEYPVVVAAEGRTWPRGARRRLAGVSSFGFSGTNAHAVIEEAPRPSPHAGAPGPEAPKVHCLPLSARTKEALRALAARCEEALGASGTSLAEAARMAGAGREHFLERAAIVASTKDEARAALRALAEGADHPALHRGTAVAGATPEVVFLFTGQGSQYPGMAKRLYETSSVFRDVIDWCDAALGPDKDGRTLKTVLAPGPTEGAPVYETSWAQPAMFAVEYGITQVWRSWGIEPAAVIGHSVGEYAAACVAGVFSLEDGVRLIAERGRLLQALPPGGAMAALFAPVEDIAAAVAKVSDRVAVAAYNAKDSAVISGEAQAVQAVLDDFARKNVQGHRLFVPTAGHSPLVAPAMDGLEAVAATVPMRAPTIPIAWNLTGGAPLPNLAPDPSYWKQQLRNAVRFAECIGSLAGYGAFLEVGPHPVLIALAEHALPDGAKGKLLLSSLRRGKDDEQEMQSALAELYVRGGKVNFSGVARDRASQHVPWPTYPFQRRAFWIAPGDAGPRRAHRSTRALTLAGERLQTAVPIFEATLAPEAGSPHVPGALLLEMAQAAAKEHAGQAARAVTGFTVREPLVLPDAGSTVQTHLAPGVDGALAFSVYGRPAEGGDGWTLHATGELVAARELDRRSAETVPMAELEEALDVHLGGEYRALSDPRRRDGEALATIALPPERASDPVAWVHPSVLEAAIQAAELALPASDDLQLLAGIERVEIQAPLPREVRVHARLRGRSDEAPGETRADVVLRGLDGGVLGVLLGVRLRRASRESLARASQGIVYGITWEKAQVSTPAARSFEDPSGLVAGARERFEALAREHGLSVYETLLPELDRASREYVADALRQLRFDDTIGRAFTATMEAEHLGIASRHARLFARLLEMLVEDGVLRAHAAGYEVTAPLPPGAAPGAWADRLARFAGTTDGELSVLQRTAKELAPVLRGDQDPLALLFPGGELAEARKLYLDSPFARAYSGALGEALGAAVAKLPADARLRVLEIGAGTGGTTTYVLPHLPADRVEYTFTDVSPLFLERAAERFASTKFMQRALFDVERDPRTQGFEPGAYDVVIAANVLHATADLARTVEHVRDLLAPGGLLLLLEGVARERWADLTFGMTEGWWRFTDLALRPSYALLGRKAWIELLGRMGFTFAAAVPDDSWAARAGAQALLVARAPARPRRFTIVGATGGVGAALARRLAANGDEVTLVAANAPASALEAGDEVVYLGALDLVGDSDLGAARRAQDLACEAPIEWLSRLLREEKAGRAWLVTQGAQRVAGAPLAAGSEWMAPLWGVGRVFSLEQPGRWGGLVDLPANGTPEALAETLHLAIDPRARVMDDEDQAAWRDGARYVPRLVPTPTPAASSIPLRADGAYLITGGFGGLGLSVARWLAEHGARHIALLGRHPDAGAEGVRAVEALGARVHCLAGDVSDEAAMTAAIQTFGSQGGPPPLRGVLHLATAVSSAAIGALTQDQIDGMLRPKVLGTVLLDRLTRDSRARLPRALLVRRVGARPRGRSALRRRERVPRRVRRGLESTGPAGPRRELGRLGHDEEGDGRGSARLP